MSAQRVFEGAEFSRALRAVMEVASMLEPFMEGFEIVGSIRRQCSFVGDGELLIRPRLGPVVVPDGLFEKETEGSLILQEVSRLVEAGVLEDRPGKDGKIARGPRYQRVAYQGLGIDLFSCLPPAEWGVLMFLRTGPVDWTKPIIRQRCQGGEILPEGMYLEGGALWEKARHCIPTQGGGQRYVCGTLVPTPTEEAFFEAIGLDWVEPASRVG